MILPVLTIYKLSAPTNRIMTRIPENFTRLLLFLFILAFGSCDSNRVFEEHIPLKNGIWNVKKNLQFQVTISDLLTRYNVYLNVRNGPEYPYSNLFLFMNTIFPDGHIARDTIELTLADYDGRWLGSGMGSVKFSRFLFREDVGFIQAGSYRFILQQAMRVNELNGIHDIGLRIEKK
jgi:gliding motility-associated lipoprotein GldH